MIFLSSKTGTKILVDKVVDLNNIECVTYSKNIQTQKL